MAKVLTANCLADGVVVFLDKNRNWSTDASQSALFESDEAAKEAEAFGIQSEARQDVVGACLIDAERREGAIHLTKLRERIRAGGPTILYGTAQALSQGKAA